MNTEVLREIETINIKLKKLARRAEKLNEVLDELKGYQGENRLEYIEFTFYWKDEYKWNSEPLSLYLTRKNPISEDAKKAVIEFCERGLANIANHYGRGLKQLRDTINNQDNV